MNPKISIIVPVFNVEKYIEKCIDSILKQTFTDFELILIDDGSTDSSGKICDKYAKKDRRLIVIHKNNEGQASARNAGLMVANGEFIGFVDSDDWIEPDMYELLYDACINNFADMSIIGLREIDEDGLCLKEYIPSVNTFSEILKRAYPWNKLFKRKLFVSNNFLFYAGKYYEDLELIPKIFLRSNKISIVKSASYNYLKRRGSTTFIRDEKILDNLWAFTQIKKFLIEENLYPVYKEEFTKGVTFFKEYYTRLLLDFPTLFLIKNSRRVISELNQICSLTINDYIKFIFKHLLLVIKKLGYHYKNKLGSIIR